MPDPPFSPFPHSYIGIVNIAKLALGMIDHLGDKHGSEGSGLQHLMALKHIQDAKLGDLAGKAFRDEAL